MRKAIVLAGSVLALGGCAEYFDQHPANVRPESEAVAVVLAERPVSGVPRSSSVDVAAAASALAPRPQSAQAPPPPVAFAVSAPWQAPRAPIATVSPTKATTRPVETHVIDLSSREPLPPASPAGSPVRRAPAAIPASTHVSEPDVVEVQSAPRIAREEVPAAPPATVSRNVVSSRTEVAAPIHQHAPAPEIAEVRSAPQIRHQEEPAATASTVSRSAASPHAAVSVPIPHGAPPPAIVVVPPAPQIARTGMSVAPAAVSRSIASTPPAPPVPDQRRASVPENVEVPTAMPPSVLRDEAPTPAPVTVSRNVPSPPAPLAPVHVQPMVQPRSESMPVPSAASAVAMQAGPANPATIEGAPAAPPPDLRCQAVARQRAEDAAANGMDPETQEVVRSGTYANCLAWDAAHPRMR